MPLNRNFDNFTNFDTNKGIMGDFTHASNLYRRNNFRLAPKVKFLYHVVIDVNPIALQSLGNNVSNLLNKREFNILASSADLPNYDINTETINQYNRKKVVQTRINYNPVNIEFHDDAAGLTTLLWEAYYRYYYEDGNYADQGTRPRAYQTGLYDSEPQNTYRHGFNRSGKTYPFFNSITIHQLHHQNTDSHFTSFTLVNPLISGWEHDRVDQSDASGIMKNTMRVDYETVLYDRGYTGDDNPAGFADNAHYDKSPSPYISTGSGSDTTGIENGWTKVFADIFLDILGITEFNTEQQRNLRSPFVTNPVTTDNRVPFNSNTFFPQSSTQTAITTAFFDAAFESTISQRELQNSTIKQRDLARNALRNYAIAQGSSNSFNDNGQLFDNLNATQQLQLQQAVVDNYRVDPTLQGAAFTSTLENIIGG
jgi:hypothetical protein